ncbi:hypothetical protein E1I18_03520 [Mycoplasmopsis mucosicanis]|uniref:Uncharacterized protein n=2 Tax=Mycoplasmopsis mucosicanis TaxID=458208 RepID=A0A507SHD6_9BACT|nr:hypothetical protein E1I18_03520 [Mycoplasmopsis mucosicanis]
MNKTKIENGAIVNQILCLLNWGIFTSSKIVKKQKIINKQIRAKIVEYINVPYNQKIGWDMLCAKAPTNPKKENKAIDISQIIWIILKTFRGLLVFITYLHIFN